MPSEDDPRVVGVTGPPGSPIDDLLHEIDAEDYPYTEPKKYADDAIFGFILLSGSAFIASLLTMALDDPDKAVYFVLAATYFALLYVALDKR